MKISIVWMRASLREFELPSSYLVQYTIITNLASTRPERLTEIRKTSVAYFWFRFFTSPQGLTFTLHFHLLSPNLHHFGFFPILFPLCFSFIFIFIWVQILVWNFMEFSDHQVSSVPNISFHFQTGQHPSLSVPRTTFDIKHTEWYH